jgi:hypothetical protein
MKKESMKKESMKKESMKKESMKNKLQETGKRKQCQCSISCKNEALPTSPFCSVHEDKCPRKSPLSGYEPDYDPDFWNNNYKIKETHNCFAYSFNINDDEQIKRCKDKNCDFPFHQPGMASGYEKFKSGKPKTCPNMSARLFGDNYNIKMTTFTDKCPVGTSKIALIVDEDEDYHFLRQDSNGYWSHKPGARKVTNLDALKKKIYDPALANYNYKKNANGYLNYDMFCSYMCVPRITPVRIKTGGGNRTRKIRGGSTKKKTIAVLYDRKNDDTINLETCRDEDWIVLSNGPTQISGYELELVFRGPEYKLEETIECLENTFNDYKKNKVIKKYKIFTVED